MNKEDKKGITIEDLAVMVANGISNTLQRMDRGFKDVEMKFSKLEEETKANSENIASILMELRQIHTKVQELKDSSNTLDNILEKHPILRIERLEKHMNLPDFVPVVEEG